ncbi:MAG: zinc ribbon domain-containing protein [Gemmatimonadaceae bacterium]
MPIYEYSCRACSNQFEALVRGSKVPLCPKCESADLERLLSLPTVKSEATHELGMRAAKRRDHTQAVDQARAQRSYELHHDD